MAYCPQCGAETSGSYCPSCGAAINPAGAQAGYGAGTAAPSVQAAGISDNVASALCYLLGLITGIIFLVLSPYNQKKTVRFHAFQSIFLHIAVIVIMLGTSVLSTMLSILGHGLGLIMLPISAFVGLGVFILWLYMLFSTYNGKTVVLPVVGPLAQKQA